MATHHQCGSVGRTRSHKGWQIREGLENAPSHHLGPHPPDSFFTNASFFGYTSKLYNLSACSLLKFNPFEIGLLKHVIRKKYKFVTSVYMDIIMNMMLRSWRFHFQKHFLQNLYKFFKKSKINILNLLTHIVSTYLLIHVGSEYFNG